MANQTLDLTPRYERLEEIALAGLSMVFAAEDKSGIPELWGRFAPYLGQIPGQIGSVTYGLCLPRDDGRFGYVAAAAIEPNTPCLLYTSDAADE